MVVLSNGSAVSMEPWHSSVPVILEGWLLGQAGGSATADLLTGAKAPAGKLAETLPARLEDTPAHGNFPGESGTVRYGEGLLIGYRWYDTRDVPVVFPFGRGLTYGTVELGELEEKGSDTTAVVRATITNRSDRAVRDVVQVYVHDVDSSVFRPEQELGGFAAVTLKAGASERVEVTLDPEAFAYWHLGEKRWVIEGGDFEIRVGLSSRDIRAKEVVALQGEQIPVTLAPESTTDAWLEHPVAGPRLREKLNSAPGGDATLAMLDDPAFGRMMRAIPLVRLSRFPGSPLDEAELPELAREFNARS